MQKLDRLFQLSHMDACIRLVASEIDSLWILGGTQLCHHVLGKIYQHRTRPSGAGDIERIFDDPSQICPVSHSYAVFGDVSGDADNVHFLKCVIANEVFCHLSGEAYQGDTVIIGSGKPGDQIGSAGAAGHQTDTDFTGGAGVSIRLMSQGLLMSRKYNGDLVLAIKLIADINRTCARIAKDHIHTFLL